MQKTKRDVNNFIPLILSKIELAKNFHQRIALSITGKTVLNCAYLKFYLRKRHQKLYLYTRLDRASFGMRTGAHLFLLDLHDLIPSSTIESVKGHLKGLVIEVNEVNQPDIIKLLKLVALMSKPKNFYTRNTKSNYSFWNYEDSSSIPIHLLFTEKQVLNLRCADLVYLLTIGVKKFDKTRCSNADIYNLISNNNSDAIDMLGSSNSSNDSGPSSEVS